MWTCSYCSFGTPSISEWLAFMHGRWTSSWDLAVHPAALHRSRAPQSPNVGRAAILRAGWLASRSALWSALPSALHAPDQVEPGGIDVLAMGIDDCRVTDVNQQDAPQH